MANKVGARCVSATACAFFLLIVILFSSSNGVSAKDDVEAGRDVIGTISDQVRDFISSFTPTSPTKANELEKKTEMEGQHEEAPLYLTSEDMSALQDAVIGNVDDLFEEKPEDLDIGADLEVQDGEVREESDAEGGVSARSSMRLLVQQESASERHMQAAILAAMGRVEEAVGMAKHGLGRWFGAGWDSSSALEGADAVSRGSAGARMQPRPEGERGALGQEWVDSPSGGDSQGDVVARKSAKIGRKFGTTLPREELAGWVKSSSSAGSSEGDLGQRAHLPRLENEKGTLGSQNQRDESKAMSESREEAQNVDYDVRNHVVKEERDAGRKAGSKPHSRKAAAGKS